MTLGHEGSLTLAAGREIRTPAADVHVVDTTGAGDVFRGGFIAGWLDAGAPLSSSGCCSMRTPWPV